VSVDAATRLLARHEQPSARPGAAAKVLALADDPDASAQQLAKAIGTDPLFAARVLRMANSSYYGLSGRVSTLPFAVSVVGFQAIRSLAVVAAAGLDDAGAAPEGFWRAAALAATAAEQLAELLDADAGDAFSLGLLHTIGAALLHQTEPLARLCLPEAEDLAELRREETERYGITHEQAGARVLAAWHFPEHVCRLIARHHEQLLPDAAPLERALYAARVVTDRLLTGEERHQQACSRLIWCTQGRLTQPEIEGLMDRVRARAETLQEGLAPRR
jgi:HD-like signal output (HDOD) protein